MPVGQTECVILFADIAGSTRLFETLGDLEAQRIVARCLDTLSDIARRKGGRLVKTIGDEIMIVFPDADAAVGAAIRMHRTLGEDPPVPSVAVAVRIGMHAGPAIVEPADVYGDVVNVAARVAAVARGGEIIATRETVDRLSPEIAARAREFDQTRLRGRQVAITLYEVLWEEGLQVTLFVEGDRMQRRAAGRLRLRYGGREKEVDQNAVPLVIGRGERCDLKVSTPFASRVHARIEPRPAMFVLVDESTNGTFVRTEDGREIALRREELSLTGAGVISLGRPAADESEHLIHYCCL